MEVERLRTFRRVSLVVTIAGLLGICVGLGVMIGLAAGQASRAAAEGLEARRDGYLQLAHVSMVLLGLAVVILGWVVVRRLLDPVRRARRAGRELPYVNAWEEAGKRYQLAGDDDPSRDEKEEGEEPPDG